jgi:hypothetical protein
VLGKAGVADGALGGPGAELAADERDEGGGHDSAMNPYSSTWRRWWS